MTTVTARRPRPWDPRRTLRIRSDEQALSVARELARRFAPGATQRDRERQLPWDELDLWSESGLGGITVPRQYGGAEVSYATLAEVFVILSQADPALGQIPQNHFGVLGLLREVGTPAQKERLYAELLGGARLGNAGPERRSASAPTILQGSTQLLRSAGGLRLSGQRFYSTGALFAHRIPTRATDDQGRVVQVWVPHDAPGVQVVDDWSSFGQRTTASGTVVFDQVPVDEVDVLAAWQLADRPGLSGPNSQLLQAAIDQGIALAALAEARQAWRQTGAPSPTVLAELGQLQTQVHAAHEVLRETGLLFDELARLPRLSAEQSAEASLAVSEAKILTTQVALAASERLFDWALPGDGAESRLRGLDRHWRNARTHTLHDPVRWKTHLIGNHLLNGVLPPRHSWN